MISTKTSLPLRPKAFTLIELLASITIISVLVVATVVYMGNYLKTASAQRDQLALQTLNDALNYYKTRGGTITALTSGTPFEHIINRLQTPTAWHGQTYQFINSSNTYMAKAQTIAAKGSGKNYHLTQFNNYAQDASGTRIAITAGGSGGGTITANYLIMPASGSTALYSADGTTWQTTTLPFSDAWSRGLCINGKYIIPVASGDKAITSTDCINWTTMTIPSTDWKDSLVAGSTAVFTSCDALYVSTDNGETWTYPTDMSGIIAYGGGDYFMFPYAGGNTVFYSGNLLDWDSNELAGAPIWKRAIYANGCFTVSSTGIQLGFFESRSGAWTLEDVFDPDYSPDWGMLAFGNGVYVAAAHNSDFVVTASNPHAGNWITYVLSDGNPWLSFGDQWGELSFAGGYFFLTTATSNQLVRSSNGSSWSVITLPVSGNWGYTLSKL